MSDMIRYHPAMIGDYTAALATQAARLENNAAEANSLIAGMADFFDTAHGSGAHAQVQQIIQSGIQNGRDVIARHSSVVDTAMQDFAAQDIAAANSFLSA